MSVDARIPDGKPHDVDLIGLAQLLCHKQRSAVLALEREDRRGEICFHAGEITHAVCGDLEGDPALLELLTWTTGELRLKPLREPAPDTVTSGVSLVLGENADDSAPTPGIAIPLLELLR